MIENVQALILVNLVMEGLYMIGEDRCGLTLGGTHKPSPGISTMYGRMGRSK